MSEWIKVPRISFPRHGGMLILRRYDDADVWGILNEMDDPAQIEVWVRNLIAVHRPELNGCVIEYLGFSWHNQWWEIGVYHASMPLWENGAYRPEMPLIPQPDAAKVIGGDS